MQQFKTIITLCWLTALLIGLVACNTAQPAANLPTEAAAPLSPPLTENGQKLKVIATYSILGDFVQNVGGDKIELHTLVRAGGDAHTFEPVPADGVALVEANLVFENGLEFETWLADLYTSSGSTAKQVVVTEAIEPLRMAEDEEHEPEEHEEHGEHAAQAAASEPEEHDEAEEHGQHHHGEFDPHVWHDVSNAMRMVETIRDGLVEADPANAATYQANAEAYLARLQELDTWVRREVETLPVERRKLVTSHDTFSYFAKAYGFEVVGSALPASTEVADPAAGEMVELVEQIKAVGVPTIFSENVSNPALIERIAAEAGVKVGPSLYTDALGESGSEGETYLKLIRYNVITLVEALKS